MRNKKVTLCYPNTKWTEWMERTSWVVHPYNLTLLGTMLNKRGYEVNIIDGIKEDLTINQFKERIHEYDPTIVGISILTNEYGKAGFSTSKAVKEVNPEIKTIFGGVHATSLPFEIIKDKNSDFVVKGEGEYVLPDLCDALIAGKDFPKAGIIHKKDGNIIDSGRAPFIENLDEIPYPDYSLVKDFESYLFLNQREEVGRPRSMPYARTITSRGCPYNCCFCEVETISGKKPRLRSVENILGELEMLIKDYKIKTIIFDDDNLIVDKNRAKNLFKEMINRKYNLQWNAPALALFKLDEDMIDLMKESGCQYVDVAIESGVERVLHDIIHKPLNLKHGLKMLNKLRDAKIDTVANFIIGFPGETWNEIREDLEFASHIPVDYVKIAIATPLPNTELYENTKKGGYLVDGFSFDKHLWTDGWIETPEFKPKYLKILRAYEWDRINFTDSGRKNKIAEMMGISEERLNEIRKDTLERAHK